MHFRDLLMNDNVLMLIDKRIYIIKNGFNTHFIQVSILTLKHAIILIFNLNKHLLNLIRHILSSVKNVNL